MPERQLPLHRPELDDRGSGDLEQRLQHPGTRRRPPRRRQADPDPHTDPAHRPRRRRPGRDPDPARRRRRPWRRAPPPGRRITANRDTDAALHQHDRPDGLRPDRRRLADYPSGDGRLLASRAPADAGAASWSARTTAPASRRPDQGSPRPGRDAPLSVARPAHVSFRDGRLRLTPRPGTRSPRSPIVSSPGSTSPPVPP